jgi:broad specificity phosphatase PhoE
MSRILLVRHGQASWGAADYDVLSDTGAEQARVLGAALTARGVRPTTVLHGAMRRQRETARFLVEGAGASWRVEEDPDWDEIDHEAVLAAEPPELAGETPTRQEFQAWFERATARWTDGAFDHEYDEPFPAFGKRVLGALERLAGRLPADGVGVVVTSGGPIARVAAELLGGGAELHSLLAPVVVNTSVSKLVVGGRGTTLVSFNDHSHLEADDLVTYR